MAEEERDVYKRQQDGMPSDIESYKPMFAEFLESGKAIAGDIIRDASASIPFTQGQRDVWAEMCIRDRSMYHLYFMVILLWFYVMMPLWRAMVKVILKRPVFWMVLLCIIQVGIDYVSSYMLGRWVTEHLSNNPVLKYLFDMRLNYWVIHYVWIFLLGAVCAERYETVCQYMWRYRYLLGISAVGSILLMLGSYYYVMDVWHYTVLEAIYTVHQMSPMGVLYTGLGTLFSLFLFQTLPMNATMESTWSEIGDKSYGIYLAHPFWLLIISGVMAKYNLLYTVVNVLAMYVMALGLSYLTAVTLNHVPKPLRKFILGH